MKKTKTIEPLTRVRDRFLFWLLSVELKRHSVCKPVADLYRRRLRDDEPTVEEWQKARADAADAAADAAYAAAAAAAAADAADAYAANAANAAYAAADADAADAAYAADAADAANAAARSKCRLRCARQLAKFLGDRLPRATDLDARILKAMHRRNVAKRLDLDMGTWHASGYCGTTHCRAGSAVWLLGAKDIEDVFGPALTGGAIYVASTGKLPDFYADNDTALADIKRCAAEQTANR